MKRISVVLVSMSTNATTQPTANVLDVRFAVRASGDLYARYKAACALRKISIQDAIAAAMQKAVDEAAKEMRS